MPFEDIEMKMFAINPEYLRIKLKKCKCGGDYKAKMVKENIIVLECRLCGALLTTIKE